jgi:hypothetical protein
VWPALECVMNEQLTLSLSHSYQTNTVTGPVCNIEALVLVSSAL